ncbi:hypothetical protein AB0F77_39580 [Streptomyces sp. NPDC026672]|uniref:hypothetical protein n=1 Tax=Actinomycetes TaxID=1760 RepID=UPI0033EB6976
MRYIDSGGDVWEDVTDGMVRVVVLGGAEVDHGEPSEMDHVEETWGPLVPIVDVAEAPEPPSDVLPTVSAVMDRASVFQSAHALVTGLTWDEGEQPSVYDVLSVAKWLEGAA